MPVKTSGRTPASTGAPQGCGYKTTVFITAAGRQSDVRRPASLGFWRCGLVLALGCGTFVTSTRIHPAPRPLVPRSASSVLLLGSGPPSEPHVDVALLEVERHEGWNRQGTDDMIERLREEAARIGCDAMYLEQTSAHAGRAAYLDPDTQQLLANCIVFTPPDASGRNSVEIADTQQRRLAPGPRPQP